MLYIFWSFKRTVFLLDFQERIFKYFFYDWLHHFLNFLIKLIRSIEKFIISTVFWNRTKDLDFEKVLISHYSKSQIFVQKFNFDKNPNIFTSFSPKFLWQFFSWNQSCQQLKSPKPQPFHEFFTPKKSTFFSGNQSWIFGQKMKISNSVNFKLPWISSSGSGSQNKIPSKIPWSPKPWPLAGIPVP